MIDYTLPLDELPDPLPIEPLTKPFDVTITPPGSKSITCRAYVLAALAEGESKIIRPLRADDTDRLLDALCTLGAEARWASGGEDVFIKGVAGRFPRGGSVNLGDGGTPARFMIAVACLAAEPVIVDGSKRMRERPVAEGVDMLRQLGAKIEYVEEEGRLPVRVAPSESFDGGEVSLGKTASSQFMSALLLVGSTLNKPITLHFSKPITSWTYLNLTAEVLRRWGGKADVDDAIDNPNCYSDVGPDCSRIRVASNRLYSQSFVVEPDASSAFYWTMAAAICPQSVVRIPGLPRFSWQADAWLINMLDHIGTSIDYSQFPEIDESLTVTGGEQPMSGISFDGSGAPDGVLAYAAAAAVAARSSAITGLHTLRVKETDRLAALENELTKIGCSVTTTNDSITIVPPHRRDACATGEHGQDARATAESATNPVIIETYNDHRMAMAFAVLGLARPGISIRNPKCVAKSYPGFWKDFAKLHQP